MARIRTDFDGVVTVGSHVLRAGDTIPKGVRVGAHLVDGGKPVGEVKVPVQVVDECKDTCKLLEPLTEAEIAEAEALGIPVDVHPERVRGALLGYQVGLESVTGQEASEEDQAGSNEGDVDAGETLEVNESKPTAKRTTSQSKKNS